MHLDVHLEAKNGQFGSLVRFFRLATSIQHVTDIFRSSNLQSPHLEAFKTKTKKCVFSKKSKKNRPLDSLLNLFLNTLAAWHGAMGLLKVVNCHLRPDSSESMADPWSYPRPFMAKTRSFKAMALTIHQYFVSSPEGPARSGGGGVASWQPLLAWGLVLEKKRHLSWLIFVLEVSRKLTCQINVYIRYYSIGILMAYIGKFPVLNHIACKFTCWFLEASW